MITQEKLQRRMFKILCHKKEKLIEIKWYAITTDAFNDGCGVK